MTDVNAEQCQTLRLMLSEAERNLNFDSTNAEFLKQVKDYQQQVQEHCFK